MPHTQSCDFINRAVMKNVEIANRQTGNEVSVITTPIALNYYIHWSAGESYLDICLLAGISKSSFSDYACRCITTVSTKGRTNKEHYL